jgi:hypothetical protein
MRSSVPLSLRLDASSFSELGRRRTWRSTGFVSEALVEVLQLGTTYVDVQDLCHEETWKNQAIADLLHEHTCGSEGRGSHVTSAHYINYHPDYNINDCGSSLADQD